MKTPATRTGQTISIPPDILREIESFEDEAAKVLSGELSQDLFRPFRLQHGIYGQRQPGVQMVRIKIPFGGLNSTQLRVIAEMAERYATGVGHVTTRQDIQLHFAALEHGEVRSEEHTSELQSRSDLVCRLLLEKKKKTNVNTAV